MTVDERDAKVKMDEFGYIYDKTDSDHTEDSEEFTNTSASQCESGSIPR